MKSADQIQAELALAAGAAAADQPDENAQGGAVLRMNRVEAVERLRAAEAKVDRLADRYMELEAAGRTKRANRVYARAVRYQAEANDLREALESPTGMIVREVA